MVPNSHCSIEAGRLKLDGHDVAELAQKHGTPLYLVSESLVRERCAAIRASFLEKYPGTRAVYASKAFQTLDMCRITTQEGLGLDVVSGGELYAALRAGVDPSAIVFHGNAKPPEELEYAIRSGVGRIVSDNLQEVALVDKIAASMNRRQALLYRITPGVDSHTHRFISTGSLDSKFGIPLDRSVLGDYLDNAMKAPHIDFKGFHFHIGSQLLDNFSHIAAAGVALDLVARLHAERGFAAEELIMGGGFGIDYLPEDSAPPLSYFLDPLMELAARKIAEAGIPMPRICIEPGRWIVGEAGITIYTIRSIKEIPRLRTYLGVDGGMADNIRPALYGAKYHALIADRADIAPDGVYTIAGRCCESGDILIENIALPGPREGDLVAVFSTGAYNHSMASNYNRLPRPAVVMTSPGEARLSVRRETYEDLVSREI
ncbi:MAG TPA: diaminopimelate decarboxylase [Rectinemataceae bacterium]